jgi:hypothetical protein
VKAQWLKPGVAQNHLSARLAKIIIADRRCARTAALRADITRADLTERDSIQASVAIMGPILSRGQSARPARQLDPARFHRDARTPQRTLGSRQIRSTPAAR